MREIATFETVQELWSLFRYLETPTGLSVGANLRLFRAGIAPKWEDVANKSGGCWSISVPKAGGGFSGKGASSGGAGGSSSGGDAARRAGGGGNRTVNVSDLLSLSLSGVDADADASTATTTRSVAASVDEVWESAVCALVGERLHEEEEVCGVVLSVRRNGDRIQVWTRDAGNGPSVKTIGRRLKAELGYTDSVTIGYHAHFSKERTPQYEV
jgi:hypothetical protein